MFYVYQLETFRKVRDLSNMTNVNLKNHLSTGPLSASNIYSAIEARRKISELGKHSQMAPFDVHCESEYLEKFCILKCRAALTIIDKPAKIVMLLSYKC